LRLVVIATFAGDLQMPDSQRPAAPDVESTPDARPDDLARAAQQIAGRLTALGIDLEGDESPDLLRALADAVERFEEAVEARGGDLMLDEPPRGEKGQPDDPDFLLPRRTADQSVRDYLVRLQQATERLLGRPDPD
jgi:hypothetical protein